eukprot:765745-Hanusia_phi.AAC.1
MAGERQMMSMLLPDLRFPLPLFALSFCTRLSARLTVLSLSLSPYLRPSTTISLPASPCLHTPDVVPEPLALLESWGQEKQNHPAEIATRAELLSMSAVKEEERGEETLKKLSVRHWR